MKAVLIKKHGSAETLEYTDFPKPEPKPGQVLAKIKATSVNWVDVLIRNGYPGLQLELPHIPGGDIVGEVEQVTEGCEGVEVGDRIIAMPQPHTIQLMIWYRKKAGRKIVIWL